MFKLLNPTKTEDLSGYEVTSLPCPMCGDQISVVIDRQKLFFYNQGALIQDVLGEFDAAVRERFMSGICQACWKLAI